MENLALILDTNVIINLYFVYEDFPEILDFLKNLKNKFGVLLITTNIIVNEIDDRKHKKQKEFFKRQLEDLLIILNVGELELKEFKRVYGLYNMGDGELSALIILRKVSDIAKILLLLTADKKDVLNHKMELKNLLKLSRNVDFLHALFLYYLMYWLKLYDKEKLMDILFSANRDLRIKAKDLREYEKEFRRTFQLILS